MRFDRFGAFILVASLSLGSILKAEVREKERETREKERETIEERLRKRNGEATTKAEELAKEREKAKALGDRYKNAGTDGASTGPGPGGYRPGAAGKSGKSLGHGESESLEFSPTNRIKGALEAEAVGRGEREKAPEAPLSAKDKEIVAKSAKEEDEALAASAKEGKNQKERIESVKSYERSKSFYKRDSAGKLVEADGKPGVADLVEKIGKIANPRTSELDLALRTMAEKMLSQGKSLEELEPALKEFVEFWNKEIKGKLPKELQENGLAYVLASLHRGPMSVAKLKATLTELLKEENPEVVLKGLVLSNKSYGEVFLNGLKEGLTIAEAHEKALKNKAAFLKDRGLNAEEMSTLPKCEVTNLLGLSRYLITSGH